MSPSPHHFTLEKYRTPASRYPCPDCETPHQFARYVDSAGNYLAEHVGRCNREDQCGYHYTPKQFFADHPNLITGDKANDWRKFTTPPPPLAPQPAVALSEIPASLFESSLKGYATNRFTSWLTSLFGESVTAQLIARFHLGSSRHWPGATVFWQVDTEGRVRAGKIMLYDSLTGKRVKTPFNHITWVHSLLKLPDFQLRQCFFGEHQLATDPYKPVAIVESEKSAVLASVFLPEYFWLATGGTNGCKWTSPEVFQALQGRPVILYPDLGAFEKWRDKAAWLRKQGLSVTVSQVLEGAATAADRAQGLDLADYLVRRDSQFGWALSDDDYPRFWDLP